MLEELGARGLKLEQEKIKYNGKHLSDANIPLPTTAVHSRIVKNSGIKKVPDLPSDLQEQETKRTKPTL